jgi:large subunit ribosomal protein L21
MRGKITALVAAVAAAAGAASAARWARGRKDEELDLEISAKAPEARATKEPAAAPKPEPAPTAGTSDGHDDLTAIKGLGKVKAAKLVAAGVTSYAQVAAWTDDDIAEMGLKCNTSPGQIKREDWVGQAKALAQG